MALFGRKKKSLDVEIEGGDDANNPSWVDSEEEAEEDTVDEEELDEWRRLDLSRDWRSDGPFDISEVDLDADDIDRVDIGTLIITPDEDVTFQVLADQNTKRTMVLTVAHARTSVMQVSLFAAPSGEDYAWKIRQEFVDASTQAKVCEQKQGPFGTQLLRVMPAKDAQGREGVIAMRDWFVSGPRWVLTARLLGRAATDDQGDGALQLEEFFRNLVVRRGEAAMVPGAPIPLDAESARS